ncbi:uncharacterized protein F4812DRAFT_410887 [Daldinia caldariorum]|uniref:uncharacterized protein n=1 Tax=Daldinia caldariorum TaxID=326644 RepID=UPI0020079A23|nr:uncharacterized protein F4812DRAFT_410887 [Daldinia caldariorum]KAI1472918.1 hypothetical protein F4812DRAFT_410887 [Daldinia caldariorum]
MQFGWGDIPLARFLGFSLATLPAHPVPRLRPGSREKDSITCTCARTEDLRIFGNLPRSRLVQSQATMIPDASIAARPQLARAWGSFTFDPCAWLCLPNLTYLVFTVLRQLRKMEES